MLANNSIDDILKFPCIISVKAIGENNTDFKKHVIQLIRKQSLDLKSLTVHTKLSKNKKYLSVTVKVKAMSRIHIDNIYQALTADEKVLYAI